jgi:PKD repeat protein
MPINLLGLKHFKKVSFAHLIIVLLNLMLLMVMLPFSTVNGSTPEIKAPPLTTIPGIDANWSVGEWDDAFEYAISNGSLTSYVRVKWGAGNVAGDFLYVIIDSPWDTTPAELSGSENYWLAFDTQNDGGNASQTDDYLFNDGFSDWTLTSWVGTGSGWEDTLTPKPGYASIQNNCNGTSPHSSTKHMVCEFRIPLTHVGSIGSTMGFYMLVIDDSADPNHHYDPPGSPRYVEYPSGAGGNSSGWVPGPNPTPAPSEWGNLILLQSPVASFIYSPDMPDANETVTFDALASQDPDGTIVSYMWDFGDGNVTTVNTAVISHFFSVGGNYDVNLTVTDDDGLNDSVVHMITIGVRAAFTFSPSAPNPSDVVVFNATASYSRSGTIANYAWNWGDTSSNDTTNRIITHTFSTGGSYDVNLTVTDDTGLNDSVVHTVDVGAPTANFTLWPSAPNMEDAVIFNASGSCDIDGNITSYAWDWGDSSSNVTTDDVINHAFSTAGNYNVTLTVTDNLGLDGSFAHSVSVYALREARFSFLPATPNVGDAVIFNASLSKDPGGAIANYTWNFDDGNITTVDAPTDTIIHIFSTNGSHNVNLTITDNDGLKSRYAHTVSVGIPPAQATAPFSPTIPTINGVWSSGEWDDANEYAISNGSLTSYVLVKWGLGNITGDFLYILIDSPWDTSNASGGVLENAYVAFDTEHDKSTIGPQLDDYLFNDGFSQWNFAWQGNGTIWTRSEINCTAMGYLATRRSGSSPKNATMHRINEFRIPLEFVGNSTSGFYVIVIDSDSDDDGWGLNLPPTRWVEWPIETGGDPRGWPVPPEYIDPCPTLDKWGYLILEPPMKAFSNVTLDISSSSITLSESVTISGTVSNSTGAIAGVDVTIQYKTGTTGWTNITTVTADSTGSYTYDWTPTRAGTYEIKTSWAGDADTYGAESEIKTLEVASEPIPILVIVAALTVLIVVVAIAVYLLKVRKPKR